MVICLVKIDLPKLQNYYLTEMLNDDKLFEIAQSLSFPALYQFATVSNRFYGIASSVARTHIRTYFPYLKEGKSEAYWTNPLLLFKTEFFHRKSEIAELNLSREEWLKIISGDLSVIPGKSNAQACYALAYVSGHSQAFAFLEQSGKGRALIFAAKIGRAEIVKNLSLEGFLRTHPYGILDEKDMAHFFLLLENVQFYKDSVREVPLSPAELEYYFTYNYSMDDHIPHYHLIRTKFVTVREATCPELHFEDIAALYAISCGYTEITKTLLVHYSQHIHVEIKGLVLENAALYGYTDVVKFLLAQYGDQIPLSGKMYAVDAAKGACRQIILDEMNNQELFQGLYWGELLLRSFGAMKNYCQSKKENVSSILVQTTNEWLIHPTKSLLFGYQSTSTPILSSQNTAQQECVENKFTKPFYML